MSGRDGYNRHATGVALSAINYTASVANGKDVDMQGFGRCSIVFIVGVDAALDGSNYWDLGIKVADDDGSGAPDTYAAVTNAGDIISALGTIASGVFATVNATAEDDQTYKVCYTGGATGKKRWITPFATETGTLNTPLAAIYILDDPEDGPPTNT